jgi:hypothetical protein
MNCDVHSETRLNKSGQCLNCFQELSDLTENRDSSVEAMKLSALNYAKVVADGGDGSNATAEDAEYRASQAMLCSARHFAAMDLLLISAVADMKDREARHAKVSPKKS